jgi:hypothetical protein
VVFPERTTAFDLPEKAQRRVCDRIRRILKKLGRWDLITA